MGLILWSIQKALPARRAAFILLLLGHFASGLTASYAAPQVEAGQRFPMRQYGDANQSSGPVGAAPFTLSNPMCQTGFTIAMRYDTRNAAGTIIKSVWVRKCTKGRIVYGRKVSL